MRIAQPSLLSKFATDVVGLSRTIGLQLTARWLFAIIREAAAIRERGDLQPADNRMGEGPFRARRKEGTTIIEGPGAFSSLRELWARDVYAYGGYLGIKDGGLIIDLGSNKGHFAVMALKATSQSKVIAVEPRADFWETIHATAALNGVGERLIECRAFLGGPGYRAEGTLTEQAEYAGAVVLTEAEFLEHYAITEVDFLKCDIEGAEVFLFDPTSRLLDLCRKVAIESHDLGDNKARDMIGLLQRKGFEILSVRHEHADCTIIAER
jgi:FkbM family methyltransferase